MGDGDGTQSDDRVLVRPYVKQQRPAEGPPRIGATAQLPVVKEPALPPPDTGEKDNRRLFWLVGGALVLILALAGGVIAIWPGGDEDAVTPPRSAEWPQVSARPSLPAQQPASASVVNSISASSLLASRSASASASSALPSTAPANSATAAGTLPPPAADRAGAITGAGGHCLDVKGGIALIGGPLSVYDCNGTPSQQWTMTTAGTLRSSGGCAGADGDGVRVTSCGDDDSGQWRAGRDGTLVNVGSGRCLTDPANGGDTGDALRLTACGGTGQRWTVS